MTPGTAVATESLGVGGSDLYGRSTDDRWPPEFFACAKLGWGVSEHVPWLHDSAPRVRPLRSGAFVAGAAPGTALLGGDPEPRAEGGDDLDKALGEGAGDGLGLGRDSAA